MVKSLFNPKTITYLYQRSRSDVIFFSKFCNFIIKIALFLINCMNLITLKEKGSGCKLELKLGFTILGFYRVREESQSYFLIWLLMIYYCLNSIGDEFTDEVL